MSAPVWHPMETAPRDQRILVWNAWEGAYESQFRDGEWPHFTAAPGAPLEDSNGRHYHILQHYPVPSQWMHLPEHPADAAPGEVLDAKLVKGNKP